MTLPEYLKIHEGARWNYEQSAFVIAHIAEVEKTYRAMIEHEQGVRLRLRQSLDEALAKVEAAATTEPAGTLVTAAKIDMEELAVRIAEAMLGINRPTGETAHSALMRGFEPHDRVRLQQSADVAVRFIVDNLAAAGGGLTAEIQQMEEHHA